MNYSDRNKDIRDRFEQWFRHAPEEPAETTRDAVTLMLEVSSAEPDDAIVDLGCGTGRHLLELYRRGFGNLCGVDYSSSAAKRAKDNLANCRGVEIFQQDFRDFLSGSYQKYKLIYSLDFTLSLYDSAQSQDLLGLIGKKLSDDGCLFAEIWNYDSLCIEQPADQYLEFPVDSGVLIYESVYKLSERQIIFPASIRAADGLITKFPDQIQFLFCRDEIEDLAVNADLSVEFLENEKFSLAQYCVFRHT